MDDEVRHFSDQEIRLRCQQETERFGEKKISDTRFCLELLRRAFYENPELRSIVCEMYRPIALRMLRKHPKCHMLDAHEQTQVVDDTLLDWIARFARHAYTLQTLPQAMKLIEKALLCRIIDLLRSKKRFDRLIALRDSDVETSNTTDAVEEREQVAQLLRRIRELFPDANDVMLCHLALIEDLAPAQLIKLCPGVWGSVKLVYSRLRQVRQIIRNDPIIRNILNLE